MADLSTLDVTQPASSDPVSQGDDAIRATRDAIVTSFGIEHALAGQHAFPNGTTAARPAPGHAGRLYLNTERGFIERDNGGAWTLANAFSIQQSQASITLAVTAVTVGSLSVTVPSGGRVLLLVSANVVPTSSQASRSVISRDGTDLLVFDDDMTASAPRTIAQVLLDTPAGPATYTYAF